MQTKWRQWEGGKVLTIGTQKDKQHGGWRGVLRDGKAVVWVCQCEHSHTNRDNDSWGYVVEGWIDGKSARTCALQHSKATNGGAQ